MIHFINIAFLLVAMFVGFVIGYTFDEDYYDKRR